MLEGRTIHRVTRCSSSNRLIFEFIDGASIAFNVNDDGDVTFSYGPKAQQVTPSALNGQHGGDHYKKLGDYQPWAVLAKWMTPEELKGAAKKDAIKYLCREADKGGRVDIEKACHTLQIYLELTDGR